MKHHPARWGATTDLGTVPPLLFTFVAAGIYAPTVRLVMWDCCVAGEWSTVVVGRSLWMFAVLLVLETAWLLGVWRRWVSASAGAGFGMSAIAVSLSLVVELPASLAWNVTPERGIPEHVYTDMLGVLRPFFPTVYVIGLAFVAAACIGDRLAKRAPSYERMS